MNFKFGKILKILNLKILFIQEFLILLMMNYLKWNLLNWQLNLNALLHMEKILILIEWELIIIEFIGFYLLGTTSYNIAYRCDTFNNVG